MPFMPFTQGDYIMIIEIHDLIQKNFSKLKLKIINFLQTLCGMYKS